MFVLQQIPSLSHLKDFWKGGRGAVKILKRK